MEKVYKLILKKAVELCKLADRDKVLYGNVFLEITDRKIELLDPSKVNLKIKNNKLLAKVGNSTKISILEPLKC